MAINELPYVRTELLQLFVIPLPTPHPILVIQNANHKSGEDKHDVTAAIFGLTNRILRSGFLLLLITRLSRNLKSSPISQNI